MPRLKPKNPPFEPDQLVKCFADFAGEHVPGSGVVKRGTTLRGDNPIVLQHPGYFVPADTPDDELPSEFKFEPEVQQHDDRHFTIVERLPDDVVATVALRWPQGGAVEKGQRLRRDDWRVQSAPEFFTAIPTTVAKEVENDAA